VFVTVAVPRESVCMVTVRERSRTASAPDCIRPGDDESRRSTAAAGIPARATMRLARRSRGPGFVPECTGVDADGGLGGGVQVFDHNPPVNRLPDYTPIVISCPLFSRPRAHASDPPARAPPKHRGSAGTVAQPPRGALQCNLRRSDSAFSAGCSSTDAGRTGPITVRIA